MYLSVLISHLQQWIHTIIVSSIAPSPFQTIDYASISPYIIYLLKKPYHLSCRVSRSVDFANRIPLESYNIFFWPPYFYNMDQSYGSNYWIQAQVGCCFTRIFHRCCYVLPRDKWCLIASLFVMLLAVVGAQFLDTFVLEQVSTELFSFWNSSLGNIFIFSVLHVVSQVNLLHFSYFAATADKFQWTWGDHV